MYFFKYYLWNLIIFICTGEDYSVASSDVVLLEGETSKAVPIYIIDDINPEIEESFFVQLLNQTTGGALLGGLTQAVVTIEASDDPFGSFGKLELSKSFFPYFIDKCHYNHLLICFYLTFYHKAFFSLKIIYKHLVLFCPCSSKKVRRINQSVATRDFENPLCSAMNGNSFHTEFSWMFEYSFRALKLFLMNSVKSGIVSVKSKQINQ